MWLKSAALRNSRSLKQQETYRQTPFSGVKVTCLGMSMWLKKTKQPPHKTNKKPRRDYSGSRALISGGGTWVTHGIWSEAGRDRRRKGWHTNLCVQSVVDNTTVVHKIMIQPAIHHCLWKTAASFPNCDRAGGLEMMPSQTVLHDTLIQSSASHTLAK